MSLEAAIGLSTGWGYTFAKTKAEEVQQGGNKYQASVFQGIQVIQLTNVAGNFIRIIPNTYVRLAATTLNSTASLTSIVACPMLASVEQGHYEKAVAATGAPLPGKLSKVTTRILAYTSNHLGDFLNYGMIAGTLALPFVGNPFFAGAMIVPVLFEAADSRKWIPRRVSRIAELYMPAISSAIMLAGGGIGSRIFSAMDLISYSPRHYQSFQRKIDAFARRRYDLKGPSLREINSPVVMRKKMSYDEICHIIEGDDDEFELNYPHCSKDCSSSANLPESRDFDQLTALFDQIDWTKQPLRQKFLDDDRFINRLKKEFPENDPRRDFDALVAKLAKEQPIEDFFASELRMQFIQMIAYIKGDERPKGNIVDIDDAADSCAKILPYLQTLNMKVRHEEVELIDILMKLGIEGGDYCARGLKRAANEIVDGIAGHISFDPENDYERKLFQNLQIVRREIMQSLYLRMIDTLTSLAKKKGIDMEKEVTDEHSLAIAQDVHTMDIYRLIFSLGFYPLTYNERRNIGFMHLFNWEIPPYSDLRMEMYKLYQESLDKVIGELGEVHFSTHLLRLIYTNDSLSEEEKSLIIDRFTGDSDDNWSSNSINTRFHRLLLCMLGILRKKAIYEEPFIMVEKTEEQTESEIPLNDWIEL